MICYKDKNEMVLVVSSLTEATYSYESWWCPHCGRRARKDNCGEVWCVPEISQAGYKECSVGFWKTLREYLWS